MNIEKVTNMMCEFVAYVDDDTFWYTSSMDFADEEGFAHYDDAKILAEEGFKLMEMTKAY